MSSENLNNLSQEELNKILKEEYEKNVKLKQEKKERTVQMIKKVKKQNVKLTQVVIIMSFLTKNHCTPPYKTPVISLSFFSQYLPLSNSCHFSNKKRVPTQ